MHLVVWNYEICMTRFCGVIKCDVTIWYVDLLLHLKWSKQRSQPVCKVWYKNMQRTQTYFKWSILRRFGLSVYGPLVIRKIFRNFFVFRKNIILNAEKPPLLFIYSISFPCRIVCKSMHFNLRKTKFNAPEYINDLQRQAKISDSELLNHALQWACHQHINGKRMEVFLAAQGYLRWMTWRR